MDIASSGTAISHIHSNTTTSTGDRNDQYPKPWRQVGEADCRKRSKGYSWTWYLYFQRRNLLCGMAKWKSPVYREANKAIKRSFLPLFRLFHFSAFRFIFRLALVSHAFIHPNFHTTSNLLNRINTAFRPGQWWPNASMGFRTLCQNGFPEHAIQ